VTGLRLVRSAINGKSAYDRKHPPPKRENNDE
jgi:hypothetical protein